MIPALPFRTGRRSSVAWSNGSPWPSAVGPSGSTSRSVGSVDVRPGTRSAVLFRNMSNSAIINSSAPRGRAAGRRHDGPGDRRAAQRRGISFAPWHGPLRSAHGLSIPDAGTAVEAGDEPADRRRGPWSPRVVARGSGSGAEDAGEHPETLAIPGLGPGVEVERDRWSLGLLGR